VRLICVADLSKLDERGGLFDRIGVAWGGLDISINPAIGVASYAPVVRFPPNAGRQTIDSHVTPFLVGSWRATKLVIAEGHHCVLASRAGGAATPVALEGR